MKKVAVIGVGSMGNPMARRIHAAGYRLTVCDRNETALASFSDLGVRTVQRAADCADCDVVIVLVATTAQLRAVALGKDGLKDGLSGRTPFLAVMSTVTPSAMNEVEAELGPLGVKVVDAPVSGGLVKAQDGTLAIMMGGRAEDVDALRPLMQTMGSNLFHCGALGSGQTTKIVNNVIGISTLAIAAEAYRIGLDNGLSLTTAIPVLEQGTGRNFFSRRPGDAPEAYAAWTRTREEFESLQAIIRKDIDLALEISKDKASLPATRALRQLLDSIGDETFETWRTVARADTSKA